MKHLHSKSPHQKLCNSPTIQMVFLFFNGKIFLVHFWWRFFFLRWTKKIWQIKNQNSHLNCWTITYATLTTTVTTITNTTTTKEYIKVSKSSAYEQQKIHLLFLYFTQTKYWYITIIWFARMGGQFSFKWLNFCLQSCLNYAITEECKQI